MAKTLYRLEAISKTVKKKPSEINEDDIFVEGDFKKVTYECVINLDNIIMIGEFMARKPGIHISFGQSNYITISEETHAELITYLIKHGWTVKN